MINYSKDKILGMLVGLHCGDSLGATLEFGDANITPTHRNIIGGGVFNWQAGEATDDTDLMLVVLKSLENDTFNDQVCIEGLIAWYLQGPKDIGNSTRWGIEQLIQHRRPSINENAQGNGSLMRSAPLSLIPFSEDLITLQSSLSHPHPHCVFADKVFVYLLQKLLEGKSKEEVYEEALHLSLSLPEFHEIVKKIPSLPWNEVKTSGYVLDTLGAALWGLFHGKSFEESLVLVVNRGDDADTCGAVTGALCGALYGESLIPGRWKDILKRRDEIEKIIGDKYGK